MKTLFQSVIAMAFLVPGLSTAAVFVGQTNASFNLREGSTSTFTDVLVDVMLTTDYGTVSWEILWDFDVTVSGGPTESFETRLAATGRYYTTNSVDLTFPDTNGTTTMQDETLLVENQFTVTERIVTFEDTHVSDPFIGDRTFFSNQFNVSNYPESVWLRSASNGGNRTLGVADGITLGVYFHELTANGGATLTEVQLGDFNNDGQVDAADYTVWRDTPGFLAPLMTSYEVWSEHYGEPHEPVAVPEPSSVLLAFLCLVLLGPCSRRVAA